MNTVYLSVPELAQLHVYSATDFLVLTVPALLFILLANEMARHFGESGVLDFTHCLATAIEALASR